MRDGVLDNNGGPPARTSGTVGAVDRIVGNFEGVAGAKKGFLNEKDVYLMIMQEVF